MGYDQREMKITARVSRHNAPKDLVHDALWALFEAKVNEILDKYDFSDICLMVN